MRREAPARRASRAQPQRVDQLLVAVEALALQVIEERTALADHLEQAAPAVVVLVVLLAVLGQVRDPLREQRDLDLGRSGVALMLLELRDRLGLTNGRNRHRILQSPTVAPAPHRASQ